MGTVRVYPSDAAYYNLEDGVPPHESPNWVDKTTIAVGDPNGSYGSQVPDDAAVAIGRSRFAEGRYQFIVRRGTVTVGNSGQANAVICEIRLIGISEDLYDFNFEAATPADKAGTLQINRNRNSGADRSGTIYRTKVLIDHIYPLRTVLDGL